MSASALLRSSLVGSPGWTMAVNVQPNPQSIAASLHGETAAKRQAITELLFFASVGDLYRVRKIVQAWGLQVGVCCETARTVDYFVFDGWNWCHCCCTNP